jgi:integrase
LGNRKGSAHTPRKSGYFEYKAVVGEDKFGLEIRKSFYSRKSYRDAAEKARKYIEEQAVQRVIGGPFPKQAVSFRVLAHRWLTVYKKGHVKDNTYTGTYEIPVEKHLIPYFGDLDISEIRHTDIQKFLNDVSRTYSAESAKKMFACLKGIFGMAVSDDIIQKDPTLGQFSRPKFHATCKKRAYTQEEYDRVLQFVKNYDGPGRLDVLVLLQTGISRSELLGLKPENVLPSQCLDIVQGTVVAKNTKTGHLHIVSDGLKNSFRRRCIPIGTELYRMLKEAASTPVSDQKKGRTILPDFLFHSPTGKVWNPDNWRKRVYLPLMDAMHAANPDIPILTAHELRHTRATLWVNAGIDTSLVLKLCGWSNDRMLNTRYYHFDPEVARKKLGLK